MIPSALLRAVREGVRTCGLAPGPLVVAVSGGADSSALLLGLAALRDELGLVLHVAHFDHRARPRAAAADAAYVADLAARAGATVRIGRAAAAPASEDEARRARYGFLRRVAAAHGGAPIATGHTLDDQAETVLLHLARGSGLAGLAAMRPARDGVVRPLLALRRADTRAICEASGVTPREDPTNRSLAFARNRVRLRVLPELLRINPRAAEALARFADAASAEESALAAAAAERLARASVAAGGLDLERLGSDALAVRAVVQAWAAAGGRALGAAHRAALARELARRAGSARVALPGGEAVREYGRLSLVVGPRRTAAPRRGGEPTALTLERAVRWRGWSLLLTARAARGEGSLVAYVPRAAAGGLAVRARRPGDRLAGSATRKVQDVLVDARIPAALRDDLPLVVAADGGVRWVPGLPAPRRATAGHRLYVRAPGGADLPGMVRGRRALLGLASNVGRAAPGTA